jgi:hypothetical protein
VELAGGVVGSVVGGGSVAVVMAGGLAVTTGGDVTTGGGTDRGNHLSQLDETVVTTTPANPSTAIMS